MPGDPGWCSLLDSNQRPAEWITPFSATVSGSFITTALPTELREHKKCRAHYTPGINSNRCEHLSGAVGVLFDHHSQEVLFGEIRQSEYFLRLHAQLLADLLDRLAVVH